MNNPTLMKANQTGANNPSVRSIEILLVEDDPGDVLLTEEVLKDEKLRTNLHIVNDGVEALAFLRQEEEYQDAPHPDLVLLDLNMPRKDGRQVLQEMKADENLKTVPVVILTTSAADEDILRSYRLQASCYITKPVDLDQFRKVVRSINDFWFTVVRFPKN